VKFVYENIRTGLSNFIQFALQNAPKLRANYVKTAGGRGFAPDPTGGAHDAPPYPLVGWGGGKPPPQTQTPSALTCVVVPSALRGLALPNFRSWRRHCPRVRFGSTLWAARPSTCSKS